MKGTEYFVEFLHAHGVRHLFGNPGHTELTLLDRLAVMPDMHYVLGLHEGAAMAMADGNAMASGNLGVFCGHVMPGFGNALGMLFNASKHGSPLLVTAGQQDQMFSLTEPFLWGDLVRQAQPLTKWAHEVRGIEEFPRALQRAAKVAMTPPTGPVFLSLPKDVMAAEGSADPAAVTRVAMRPRADIDAIRDAARVLLDARSLLIIAGDEVGKSGAESELETVAGLLGAAVYSETSSVRFNFPIGNPLYQGSLARIQKDVHALLSQADVVFAVGAEVLTSAAAAKTDPLPSTARLVQLNLDSWQLGKNYVASPALWGDAKATLQALAEAVRDGQSEAQRRAADERGKALAQNRLKRLAGLEAMVAKNFDRAPLTGAVAMNQIVQGIPEGAVIVDESATAGLTLRAELARRPHLYFCNKAGGLGWGVPASIGIALAMPDRPVFCVTGDGGALFSIQALWTAAHHRCRIIFVICNNSQYALIKHRLHLFGGGSAAQTKRYLGVELNDPAIEFCDLARSMGLWATRVERAREIPDAIASALGRDGPALIDLRTEGSYPEREQVSVQAAAMAADQ